MDWKLLMLMLFFLLFIVIILIILIKSLPLCHNKILTNVSALKTLKITPPTTIDQMLKILKDMHKFFDDYDIPCFMDGGTLLGSIRHKGIIPWDDDIDIGIFDVDVEKFLKLKTELKTRGYDISTTFFGFKIFFKNWSLVPNHDYSYPFLDVFIYEKTPENIYSLKTLQARQTWSNAYYKGDEIFPLKLYQFKDFKLYGPQNPLPYLIRQYGPDWDTVAYHDYDHQNNKPIKKILIKLKPEDKIPAKGTIF